MRSIAPAIHLMQAAQNFLAATHTVFTDHGLNVVNIGFEVRYTGDVEAIRSELGAFVFYCLTDQTGDKDGTVKLRIPVLPVNAQISVKQCCFMVEEAIKRAVLVPSASLIDTPATNTIQ